MKRSITIFSLVAALVAVVAFTSCDNNQANPVTTVAVYKADYDFNTLGSQSFHCSGTDTITFKSNGTWVEYMQQTEPDVANYVCAKGTYSGNPAVDGTITFTTTVYYLPTGEVNDELSEDYYETNETTITSGTLSLPTQPMYDYTRQ